MSLDFEDPETTELALLTSIGLSFAIQPVLVSALFGGAQAKSSEVRICLSLSNLPVLDLTPYAHVP